MGKMIARDHLLARGKFADRANRFLGKAWDRGWLPEAAVEPEAVWLAAAKSAGIKTAERAIDVETAQRSESEIEDFRLRLSKLCEAINSEAKLNPLGRAMAFGQLTRVVAQRLSFGDLWQREPDLAHTQIAPPILIIGHMRSGTTRIHKLLAADPAHSHTRYCDAWHPVPRTPDLRQIKSRADLFMLETLNPWLQSIHPMASGEVEEELAWLAGALNHSIYESQWHIPSYSAFSEARDPEPVYRELERVLRTDAAHRKCAHRPRVMKAPQFSEDLACLLKLFPDARVVVAERDKEAVLKSAVSLVANQMAIQSDACDLDAITALYERKIALRNERREAALNNWNGPVARLAFDDLTADWEREIARAYRELGMELSAEARSAMRAAMQSSASSAHHGHAEQLSRFDAQLMEARGAA